MTQDAFCGCSDTARPLVIYNRPGLSEIAYRVGTFASFREAMLLSISQEAALAHLTSRESDDYAITILELFAALADVLSFYNERIANELYLRTARERDSLLRLTGLLGYRLRPGLAAETLLSFALDAGAETRIRKGFKVMSVPGQDEKAQIFETIEALAAHGDLNEAAAFAPPVPFNGFALGSTGGPIVARPEKLAPGAKLIFFGLGGIEEKLVTALTSRADGELIAFEPAVAESGWVGDVARIARLDGRLRFFGSAAPENVNVYVPAPTPTTWPKWETQTVDASLGADTVLYPLDARLADIATGAQLLVDAGPDAVPRLRTATIVGTEDRPARLGTIDQLTETVTHLELRQTLRGRPGLAPSPAGLHAAYARSGSGSVMALDPPAALRRWNYLGLPDASSDVHAVTVALTRQDIFVRDSALRMRQRLLLADAWGAWVDHGGILTTEPRPVVRQGGGVFVFVRGTDLGLWAIDVTSGAPGSWIGLGGVLTSPPAPVSHKPGSLAVFVRGTDRALWYRLWDGAVWTEWESLKGLLASGPDAASTGGGRIDVAALDDAGGVIHRKWDGTAWSEWRTLGGTFTGDVTLVAGSPDRIDVFVRDKDGVLWTNARNGETWGEWHSLGGRLTSSPAAVRDVLGLHVYARGGDGSIASRSFIGGSWTAWASHGNGIGAIPDRRKTAIYRLGAEDIIFRNYDYPARIRQGRLALRMRPGARTVGNITKGRHVLLRSSSGLYPVSVIAATPFAAVAGELDDHLFVDFTPGPETQLNDVTLLGNVAAASHGETQPIEALGHGEGAKGFQAFKLSRPNLTYLQSATALEGSAALEIRVNGEQWQETSSFFGRKSTERVYTARQNDGGETRIMFGDGATGARLPSGAMNISAVYRTGLGLSGRMKADQLSIPLERPVGFREVTNPLPADGAADPETLDEARSGAPRSVRTFGRAVSLADFEAIATASGLAARASVTWTWSETERAVHVTVAGPQGVALSAASLARLRGALDSVRDPNRPLFLANFVRVPIVVTARLLRNPAYEADAMLEDARARLLAFFAFDAMPLGEAVFASQIYAELQSAKGVVAADVDVFQLKHYDELTLIEQAARAVDLAPRQPHIRIFPARPAPPLALIDRFARAGFTGAPPPVLAAEQAFIADPATDLILTAVEAL
ncbi:hypothetical protein G5V57_20275 [Nordella sp. HKS 07]|uniref:hypothetical protein n=1 Tax=Nordella sp. HKS 07 TaxID=2712222 RepID=UPI0013E18E5D|nr:hypothetical protein [Nordella sp. HKS 07]QIG49851.1 hypothetical protein G5V57_20275 [Nordella sp. HKS 07]